MELGLTCAKFRDVASVTLPSRRKVAQAKYLSPTDFEEKRSAQGVREAHIYDIRLGADGA